MEMRLCVWEQQPTMAQQGKHSFSLSHSPDLCLQRTAGCMAAKNIHSTIKHQLYIQRKNICSQRRQRRRWQWRQQQQPCRPKPIVHCLLSSRFYLQNENIFKLCVDHKILGVYLYDHCYRMICFVQPSKSWNAAGANAERERHANEQKKRVRNKCNRKSNKWKKKPTTSNRNFYILPTEIK